VVQHPIITVERAEKADLQLGVRSSIDDLGPASCLARLATALPASVDDVDGSVRSQRVIGKLNDVELFDLQSDSNEMDNLAMAPRKNVDLLSAMNAKLNRLVDAEVGEDVGQMLPGGVDAGWVATPAVNDI